MSRGISLNYKNIMKGGKKYAIYGDMYLSSKATKS